MYGADGFAIKIGNKIVAEHRGGMYLITLVVYWEKVNLHEETERSYKEEAERYKTKTDRFTIFKSLKEYAEKFEGDVLFYLTPKRMYCLNDNGTKTTLQTHILKNHPGNEPKEWQEDNIKA